MGGGRLSGPLHVTNGRSAAAVIAAAGLGGEPLSWADVLYEGPVPAGLGAAALAEVRAAWAGEQGWAPAGEALATYRARDAALDAADGVVLWFEHDLHDQLQLLQVLDRLAGHAAGPTEAILVDRVPGRPDLGGLGELTAAELAALWPQRRRVTAAQLALGQAGWAALRSPDPTAVDHLRRGETRALRLLEPALERLLEELPAVGDGLARSERQLLAAVAAGAATGLDAFRADARQEQAPFAGDAIVLGRLVRLAAEPEPLLDGPPDGPLALTPAGQDVLAGRADAVALRGLDRWLGGVRLDADAPWRWDRGARVVVGD